MKVSAVVMSQYREAVEVAVKSFEHFDASDYSSFGKASFLAYASFWCFSLRQLKGHNSFCTNDQDGAINGMIELRDKSHITMLFVLPTSARQGCGSSLIAFAERFVKQQNKDCKKMTVNSSPFAFEFYKKMGYVQIKPLQDENGFLYIPMEKEL